MSLGCANGLIRSISSQDASFPISICCLCGSNTVFFLPFFLILGYLVTHPWNIENKPPACTNSGTSDEPETKQRREREEALEGPARVSL